jgi:NAD(P)-dependent dehydrogenase (short-subunit alcohol dehydrogenase family)
MAKALESAPGKLYPLKCDVTKETSVKEAFSWVKSKLGGADIHVNNAGVCDYHSLVGQCTWISRVNCHTFVTCSVLGIAK